MSGKERLETAIDEIYEILREETSNDCVSVSLHFNAEGYEIVHRLQHAMGLELNGINMRNMRGKFIKVDPL